MSVFKRRRLHFRCLFFRIWKAGAGQSRKIRAFGVVWMWVICC